MFRALRLFNFSSLDWPKTAGEWGNGQNNKESRNNWKAGMTGTSGKPGTTGKSLCQYIGALTQFAVTII